MVACGDTVIALTRLCGIRLHGYRVAKVMWLHGLQDTVISLKHGYVALSRGISAMDPPQVPPGMLPGAFAQGQVIVLGLVLGSYLLSGITTRSLF